MKAARAYTLTNEQWGEFSNFCEVSNMNGQRCILTLLSIAVNCCVGVQIASSQNLTNQWVEKVAGPLVENRVVDGLSVGYIEGEHFGIVHLGSSSQAGKKADYLTVYEIGSVSKVFTGLMLADAVVRGEIDLNAAADIANAAGIRLPSRDGRSIQWIDLSTHRAGLPRLPGNLPLTESVDPYRDYDSKMAATFLNQYELPRPPGKSQEYSNLGGSLLGYLLAEKAGKSYEQLLRERIAEPLRMTDCTVSLSSDQRKRLATPHDKFGSATPPWTFADLPGAGGIHATMRDMMRFAKAQLTPPAGTLGEAIELAWKQHSEADGSGPATGLGWMIAGDSQTRWHNGRTGGFTSALFINRQLNCAVIVLCNTSIANEVDQLAMQLVTKAAGQEVKPEPSDTSDQDSDDVAIDAKLRRRLVGRYQLAPDFIFTIRDRDGHLMVSITNQPTQEVYPDSPTRWSYRGVDATLEFELTKTGPARSLVLHQNGAEQTAYRIKPEPSDTSDHDSGDYPKRAPFTGVRWEGEKPEVKIGEEWFTLVSLDGIAAGDIVAFSRRTYENKWRKRFEEDLVEVLAGMGHEPKDTVRLVVLPLGSSTTRTLEGVAMTEANRRAIRESAPAIDPELRGRLVGRYQLTPDFIFTVQDRDGRLMVGITNQPTQEVYPDSPTRWSYRGVDATLEFKLSKTGRAKSLVLHQNGARQTARRIDPEPGDTSDQNSDNLAIDAKLRRRLVGRYQLNPNFIFTVRDRDGRLMVSITNQPTQEVHPDSPTRWSYRGLDATLEFKLPKTGRARSLVLHQNGAQQTARRMD